ncbi:MAG: cytochrome c biogenesis protein CcdA [Chloroflexota bacterium]|nr:cytochrome c biogenesis protein CcdA [Chloroflexota bacterium]
MIESFVSDLSKMLPFGYAFGAGMVTAVSPCGIAMLPAYVSLYLGEQGGSSSNHYLTKHGVRALAMSGMVTLGFVAFFGIIGAILSLGGEFLLDSIPWIAIVVAVVIIVMGIYTLSGGHLYTNLPS